MLKVNAARNRLHAGRSRRVSRVEWLESRQLLSVTAPPLAGAWNAALSEDFNTLNTGVWTNSKFWWGQNGTYEAAYEPQNASVSNGALSLTALHQSTVASNGQVMPLQSGMIQTGGLQGYTPPGFAFTYGYVDVSCQCAAGSGIWSALWMLPISHQDGYEIDVLENKGLEPGNWYGGYHDWRDNTWAWGSSPMPFNGTTGFHDYAVDWEPGSLTFYVDGKVMRSYTGSNVPSQPMYLILNLDASSGYAGPTANAPASASMKVDYVRVWQHAPSYQFGNAITPAVGQFADPSFESIPIGATDAFTPSTFNWIYNGAAGLEGNGGPLGGANAPSGAQVAFLQGISGKQLGNVGQQISVATAGSYQVSFSAAQRAGYGVQPISVSVDGSAVATLTPSSTAFATYATPTFNLSAGLHNIVFSATVIGSGKDADSFIDAVNLNPVVVVNPLPSVWSSADIGAPALAGSAGYSGGVYTVSGAGADIWNASDQFHFVSQSVSGDNAIVARVTSQTVTDPWAKAGVMERVSTAANAAWVSMVQTPGNGVDLQWRDASGNLGWTPGPALGNPAWVKLTRSGNTFTGYESSNGATWTQVGQITLTMPAALLAGLAVTSHNSAAVSTATFDNVSLTKVLPTTTTALSASPAPSTYGQIVTFTATVSSTAGVPGGTVSFYDGSALLAAVALSAAGQASYATSALAVATHSISAVYSGSAGYQASASTTLAFIVNPTTPPINFGNGFAGAAGLTLNGSAAVVGSALQLTNGGTYEAASAFSTSASTITRFTASFDFQLSAGASIGHGFTFTIQGQGPTALGQSGGGLGYGNDYVSGAAVVTKSVAIKFDLYNNEGEGNDSTGLFTNGANPTSNGSVDLSATGIDLHSGDKFNVALSYDGATLTVIITDTVTKASATQKYTVNIPSIVGGNSAYVGFTAGTGGLTATQSILDWTFNSLA